MTRHCSISFCHRPPIAPGLDGHVLAHQGMAAPVEHPTVVARQPARRTDPPGEREDQGGKVEGRLATDAVPELSSPALTPLGKFIVWSIILSSAPSSQQGESLAACPLIYLPLIYLPCLVYHPHMAQDMRQLPQNGVNRRLSAVIYSYLRNVGGRDKCKMSSARVSRSQTFTSFDTGRIRLGCSPKNGGGAGGHKGHGNVCHGG